MAWWVNPRRGPIVAPARAKLISLRMIILAGREGAGIAKPTGTMTDQQTAPLSHRFLRNRGRTRMSAEEIAALEAAFDGVRTVAARKTLIEKGAPVQHSTLLIDGVMCRYLDDNDGQRQLLGVHIAGDFVDLHGFPLERLDHDVATLTEATIATIPRERVMDLVARFPNLARVLWRSTMLDAAMHREWIFRLGRLGAQGRVAHFFSEMETRLRLAGLGDENATPLPINQTDVAEACGLTPVHVNRVLRVLREDGLLTFRSGVIRIDDRHALHRLAEFDDEFLYPDRSAAS
jgi:CRP-like cAMP-binding protein